MGPGIPLALQAFLLVAFTSDLTRLLYEYEHYSLLYVQLCQLHTCTHTSSLPCPGGPLPWGPSGWDLGLSGRGGAPEPGAGGARLGGGVLSLEAERGAGGRGGAGPNWEDRKPSLRGGLPGRAEGVRAEGAGPGSRAGRGGRASRDPARSPAQVRGLSRDAQESCWPCVWVSPSPSRYLCIGQTWVRLLAAADQL